MKKDILIYVKPECEIVKLGIRTAILGVSETSTSIKSVGFSGLSSVEDGGELE